MFKVNRKGVVTTETGSLKQTNTNIVAFFIAKSIVEKYGYEIFDCHFGSPCIIT